MSSRPGARPSSGTILIGLAAVVVGVLVAIWVVLNGQAIAQSFFPPAPASSQARDIHDLYTIVFIIAAAIFFVVEGLIVWTVIRYRRKPGDDELPPQTHGHNLAEIVWTVVPTLIVIFLFFVSWQTLNKVEAKTTTPDLLVRAHAGQFQWQFDYMAPGAGPTDDPVFSVAVPQAPDGLHLPAGETTHFFLTSNDVIHAFYVPSFLFKRDVVPGHVNEFDLSVEATWAGQVIHGQCAELCGIGHDIMLFDVSIQSPADFKAWYDQKVAEAKASPTPPPSGEPGGSGAPPPQGGGTVLDVVAKNVQFDVKELTAPANQPFTIHFDNQDAGTPHDVDILDSTGKKVEDNKDFNGVATMDYQEKPLPAGTYKFECSIHPTIMFGTLTVQ
jgi:cytochrome c oxidase subunit 2